jgi:hypothetical protein
LIQGFGNIFLLKMVLSLIGCAVFYVIIIGLLYLSSSSDGVVALVTSSSEAFPIKIGDTTITITKETFPCPTYVTSDCPPLLAFLNLHEDENTSVVAARSYLYVNGGSLVKFSNGPNRLITFSLGGKKYSVDPNRIFTPEGIKATLQTYSSYSDAAAAEVTKLASMMLEVYDFDNVVTILTLHNNGGGYGANSYLPGGVYENDAEKVNIPPESNPSDFYYVVDDYFYDTFVEGHYCAVLQNNATVANDGSLSYFAGLQGKPYVNFEALSEHGSVGTQVLIQLDMIYAARKAILSRGN